MYDISLLFRIHLRMKMLMQFRELVTELLVVTNIIYEGCANPEKGSSYSSVNCYCLRNANLDQCNPNAACAIKSNTKLQSSIMEYDLIFSTD